VVLNLLTHDLVWISGPLFT